MNRGLIILGVSCLVMIWLEMLYGSVDFDSIGYENTKIDVGFIISLAIVALICFVLAALV